jgi:hypothetical protein
MIKVSKAKSLGRQLLLELMLDGSSIAFTNDNTESTERSKEMMTYDVLTRKPEPDFAFLVGRPPTTGVPAREFDKDPGASSG